MGRRHGLSAGYDTWQAVRQGLGAVMDEFDLRVEELNAQAGVASRNLEHFPSTWSPETGPERLVSSCLEVKRARLRDHQGLR